MTVKRPGGVAAVAWVWIVSGVLIILSGLMGIGALAQISELTPPHQRPALPPLLAAMSGLSHYLILVTLVQMAVAAVAVVAGVYYLRLRAWARSILELLTWMSLVLTLSLGFLWMPMWMGMSNELLPSGTGVDPRTLKAAGVITGAAVMIVGAVPLILMIKSLRSRAAREAVGARPEV